MKFALTVLLSILLLAQLIRPERTNPDFDSALEIKLDETIKPLIVNACYDCHSFETTWPWYSNIFPMSYTIAKHVRGGRHMLNFSLWQELNDEEQKESLRKIRGSVVSSMPLLHYTMAHEKAQLSNEEREMIRNWVEKELEFLP